VRLDPELERIALSATQILGLRVAGVDLIESDDGPLVLEVNSSPGLEGIESATGIDVASEIVEHLEQELPFPELDLQQRLTAASGHGVGELVVGPGSSLAGRTLTELELSPRGVAVLTLTRGVAVHANPDAHFALAAGDRLLCFGPYKSLRALGVVPQ
jgi:ribosomal protein S6--L-glutamate ligase